MKKILVVDDDKDLVQLVKLSLESKGHIVKGIYDGKTMKQTITDFSPELILLDVYLGEHNGIDICKEIKANSYTKHIKIIIFSTHHKKVNALDLCEATGFIRKPFYMAQLHAMIEEERINL